MKLRWTEPAIDDLAGIKEYISRDSARNAKRVVREIRKTVGRLRSFPKLGGVVEQWGREDLRELVVGIYRIIYLVLEREIHVVSVTHGARRLREPPEL
jgi:toxin ParE1/3/4